MSDHVFILGAGASYEYDAYPFGADPRRPEVELVPASVPLSRNMLTEAIKRDVFRKTQHARLAEYIRENSHRWLKKPVTFEDLKSGAELDVEQVYISLEDDIRRLREPDASDPRWWALAIPRDDLLEIIRRLLLFIIYSTGRSATHGKLADYCRDSGATIVSFNWDTLIDDALAATGCWFYGTGYGIQFFKTYQDQKVMFDFDSPSIITLLKPHGSINWFRYSLRRFQNEPAFTGEAATDDELSSTGLFVVSPEWRKCNHPVDAALNLGAGFNPKLKVPADVDILPPGEAPAVSRPQFARMRALVGEAIRTARTVTIIGFALKDSDSDSKRLFYQARQESSIGEITVEVVDKVMSDPIASAPLRTICEDTFRPCQVEFLAPTFKEYCARL
jgi:hypothetical protein